MRHDRAGVRWAMILLVTLIAFAWQCFVTQTHIHAGPEGYAATHSGRIGAVERPRLVLPSADMPDECPICDEIAHSGHLLLPPSFVLPAPPRVAPLLAEIPPFAQLPPARSHAWRSRAPPHILQI